MDGFCLSAVIFRQRDGRINLIINGKITQPPPQVCSEPAIMLAECPVEDCQFPIPFLRRNVIRVIDELIGMHIREGNIVLYISRHMFFQCVSLCRAFHLIRLLLCTRARIRFTRQHRFFKLPPHRAPCQIFPQLTKRHGPVGGIIRLIPLVNREVIFQSVNDPALLIKNLCIHARALIVR